LAKSKKAKLEASESVAEPEAVDDAPRQDAPAAPETAGPADWLVWLKARLPSERVAVWVVLGLGALLFLPFLGSLTLWDPWETHYGEVAREMITRDDYVYPYWESSYFFSKPAFPMWLMAAGMLLVGAEGAPAGEPLGAWTEWGVRVPFALIAIGTMWAVYRIGRQLGGRAAGVVSAIVLGSSAQFIFIGKQSMVDMPYVGLMTIGLALFIAAVFDEEEDRKANTKEKALAAFAVFAGLAPQLILIGRELEQGAAFAALGGAALLGAVFMGAVFVFGSKRDCFLVGFYVLMALSTFSKGLAPLIVVGPMVLLYIALTLDWRVLLRSKVYVGWALYLLVASPWYLTISLFNGRDEENKTFVDRFWIHDHFSRVGAGVHGDRAGLGYFMEQLAYGMFPWAALIPGAVGWASRVKDRGLPDPRRNAMIFVLVWALWSYLFFSVSQTKFHHYIFPAVPALAVLVGLWFVHLAEDPERRLAGWVTVPIVVLFAVSARDLINDPQNLVNLFTYKYDRDYPRDINPRIYMDVIVVLGSVGMLGAYLFRQRGRAMLAFGGMAVLFGAWISHHHFNHLAPHWGQKHLLETYFDEKKGDEPIYAYQLNWRGETFYSRNKILQVKESGANQRIKELVDRPGREFIITEQSRYHTLKSVLSPDKRDKIHIIDRSNNKFYLTVVED
jgi:4-amino-4-deoxy-L-arabinose transferase-like glycosyltransferase